MSYILRSLACGGLEAIDASEERVD